MGCRRAGQHQGDAQCCPEASAPGTMSPSRTRGAGGGTQASPPSSLRGTGQEKASKHRQRAAHSSQPRGRQPEPCHRGSPHRNCGEGKPEVRASSRSY
ncbi:hypothetical protein NicSoilC5_07280 [Arthrobacter sp. NicSoilC5]|nr:hypothetical protein NicSoilC5_07280 [Arthrobacter sp. NicSoilC5]